MKKFLLLILSLMPFLYYSCKDKEEESDVSPKEEQKETVVDTVKISVSGNTSGYDYVDLGLESGLMWATYNVGSMSLYSYGDYYAWGQVTPWTTSSAKSYSFDISYDNTDRTLLPEYDAVTKTWGDYWRMPTNVDFTELENACSWKFVENINNSGVSGFLGTSKKNGNTIFLPAGGSKNSSANATSGLGTVGNYRTSSIYDSKGKNAWNEVFGQSSRKSEEQLRIDGMSVRGVTKKVGSETIKLTVSGKANSYDYVDLGLESGMMWATYNVGAMSTFEYGNYYAWGQVTPWTTSSAKSYSFDTRYDNTDRTLLPEYDAVTKTWGDYWRMPTNVEFTELENACSWKFVENINNSGVSGFLGTSKKNGNTIFLPAGGSKNSSTSATSGLGTVGNYRTSSIYNSYGENVWNAVFSQSSRKSEEQLRIDGMSVRGVTNLQKVDNQTTTDMSGSIGSHNYVDLGLPSGLLWASYNLGATSPTQYGGYYAWGETSQWKEYTFDNYVYDKPYCNENKVLLPKYDAATVNWGNYWRMPTYSELDELLMNCDWKYTTNYKNSGVAGFVGTSKKNSNLIFLPAGGLWNYDYNSNSSLGKDGYYRASDFVGMASSLGQTKTALGVKLISGGLQDYDAQRRADGICIRPVTTLSWIDSNDRDVEVDKEESSRQGVTVNGSIGGYTYVDLGFPSGKKWATYNLGASSPEQHGNYYAWGETKPKSKYTWDNYKFFSGYDEVTSETQMTKYVRYKAHGAFDNLLKLANTDDAAVANWGSNWHLPTQADIKELVEGCTWKRIDNLNGSSTHGYMGYSRYNDMKIYIPCAGFEYSDASNNKLTAKYWSSEIYKDGDGKIATDYKAACMSTYNGTMVVVDFDRPQGFSIRAVHD